MRAVILATACMFVLCACNADRTDNPQYSTPAPARVEIELGHCFVEPVTFDGEMWNVAIDQQFGWGGMQPSNWRGRGLMVRIGENRARYRDDGGGVVIFLPVDDPSVQEVEKALCA